MSWILLVLISLFVGVLLLAQIQVEREYKETIDMYDKAIKRIFFKRNG